MFSNTFSIHLPPKTIRLSTVTSEKGLSNNWVNCFVEDDRGFIWIGTRSGLNIFDGTNVEVIKNIYQDNTKISFNDVSYLEKTKSNLIVIGTWGKGIYILNPHTKKVLNKQENIFEKSLNVKKTIERKDSAIWIATFGNGLIKYDIATNQYIACKQPKIQNHSDSFMFIESMVLINDTIWILNSDGGLAFVAPNSMEIELVKDINEHLINFAEITAISSRNNILILGTRKGDVYFVDTKSRKVVKKISVSVVNKEKFKVKDFVYDDKGVLWIVTVENLFKYYESKDELEKLVSATSEDEYKAIFCCYKDSRNIIWFGSWGNGLHYNNDNTYSFTEISLGNTSNFALCDILRFDFRNLLIGTSKGIKIYDTQAKTHNDFHVYDTNKKKLIFPDVVGIIPYEDRFLININEYGFFFMDKKGYLSNIPGVNYFSSSFITSDCITHEKEHWVGSQIRGLLKIKEGENKAEEYFYDAKSYNTLKTNSILSIAQTKNKFIWIGTRDGLFKYQKNQNTFVKEDIFLRIKSENIPLSTVKAIKEDNHGNLWLGTSYGLVKYDVENKVEKIIGAGNEVLESLIYNFILIDNYMWATTKAGLIRINTLNNEYVVYTINSGLWSNSFNDRGVFYSEAENLLYLSNLNSIICFNPKSKVESKSKLKIVFKDFSVNEKKASTDNTLLPKNIFNLSTIILSHDQNNIAFELSIQDFSPNLNGKLYAVKLVGQDKDFVLYNYGERVIRFTNLPPKEYQLLIYSINQDGSLGTMLNKMDLVIKKPFWLTYWFLLLVVLVTAGLIYFVIVTSTKKITNKNKLLQLNALETSNSIEKTSIDLQKHYVSLNNTKKHASFIQKSIFPNKSNILPYFNDYFVFHMKKELVSSNFYWLSHTNGKTIVAFGDCSYCGFSDSLLTIILMSQLKVIVEENSISQPNLILKALNTEIEKVFEKNLNIKTKGIGMTIICLDQKNDNIEISSAMNTLFLKNKSNEIIHVSESNKYLGIDASSALKDFKIERYTYSTIDTIYLFSDGYQNQIGGEINSHYSLNSLKELVFSISHLTTLEQSKLLENELYLWQGKNPQTDDVLILGLKL